MISPGLPERMNGTCMSLCGLCLTKRFAFRFYVCLFLGKQCSRRPKQELKRSHGSAPTVLEATTFQIFFRVHHLQVSMFEHISGLCVEVSGQLSGVISVLHHYVGSRGQVQVIMIGDRSLYLLVHLPALF